MNGTGGTDSLGSHTDLIPQPQVTAPGKKLGQLSLGQMLKVVVFAAVGSACLAPGLRTVEAIGGSLPEILLVESAIIPLVWCVLAMFVVRRGALKDWIVLACLAVSTSIAWCTFVGVSLWISWHAISRYLNTPWRPQQHDWDTATFLAFVFVILTPAEFFLARRVLPRKCPVCGWTRRVWVRSARRFGTRSECLRCGTMFVQLGHQIEALSSPRRVCL